MSLVCVRTVGQRLLGSRKKCAFVWCYAQASLPQDIRTHYVFGYFAWDVVACCPIDLWADERNATSQGILARPRATLRLLKLLHMRHLFAKGGDESHGGFYTAAWSMIVFILLLVHFLACIWCLRGSQMRPEQSEVVSGGHVRMYSAQRGAFLTLGVRALTFMCVVLARQMSHEAFLFSEWTCCRSCKPLGVAHACFMAWHVVTPPFSLKHWRGRP